MIFFWFLASLCKRYFYLFFGLSLQNNMQIAFAKQNKKQQQQQKQEWKQTCNIQGVPGSVQIASALQREVGTGGLAPPWNLSLVILPLIEFFTYEKNTYF